MNDMLDILNDKVDANNVQINQEDYSNHVKRSSFAKSIIQKQ